MVYFTILEHHLMDYGIGNNQTPWPCRVNHCSDVTWVSWRSKLPATGMFALNSLFRLTAIKTKCAHYCESTSHCWIPLTQDLWCGKRFRFMTSPCGVSKYQIYKQQIYRSSICKFADDKWFWIVILFCRCGWCWCISCYINLWNLHMS